MRHTFIRKSPRQIAAAVALITVLFAADQLTKWLAVCFLKNSPDFALLPGVFELSYVENTGAAFGLFQGKAFWLGPVSMIAIVILFCLYAAGNPVFGRSAPKSLCLLCLIAGAAGNMADRILKGYVVDFFSFCLIDFPVFNLADCYITLAAIGFCILTLTEQEDRSDVSKRKHRA